MLSEKIPHMEDHVLYDAMCMKCSSKKIETESTLVLPVAQVGWGEVGMGVTANEYDEVSYGEMF